VEIIATGYIQVYERGGYYTLRVRDVAVAGLGGLAAAFEKLKEKLAREGLFDEARKRDLPFFPKKVAVVTSETGAAVRDILKIIQKRNNCVDVLVYPAKVQGEGAAAEIAVGIETLNRLHPEIDCMIVGRGGGSMEELWAFNEERVARSIFLSKIPVISAVGHETDFTIADFAADKRAETPTAAAQMAVPDLADVRADLAALAADLTTRADHRLETLTLRVRRCDRSAMAAALSHRVNAGQWRAESLRRELLHVAAAGLQSRERRAGALKTALDALDPAAVLQRGYAILTGPAGALVKSVQDVKERDPLTATLGDGTLALEVKDRRGG
jgi:exodeoxyribonuclease VII large subunit